MAKKSKVIPLFKGAKFLKIETFQGTIGGYPPIEVAYQFSRIANILESIAKNIRSVIDWISKKWNKGKNIISSRTVKSAE